MNVFYSGFMSEFTHPPLDLSETPWIHRGLPSPPRATIRDGASYAAAKHPPTYQAFWSDRRLRLTITIPSLCALLGIFAGVLFAASIQRPEVETATERLPKTSTRLLAADGGELRKYSRENRILLKEGELPELLAHAIVDTEDARFYRHGGVDPKAILRAVVVNLVTGKRSEGASTLTMQYARGLFNLSREKAWMRKIEEAFLAVELEKRFSKQQILTMYANHVNLGHGNYGMEAGARAYFDKSVHELSLAEAATLAGIPQRPADYS
ncbi:Penicillin-binding protein 1A, partial [Exaiptasia diaphana]